MDKKILDKIKETLDSSYEIQKDIKENVEDSSHSKNKLRPIKYKRRPRKKLF